VDHRAESRAEVHSLRAACQATVVGSGTQQADNPHLAVRSAKDDPNLAVAVLVDQQPWRVIVDTHARTPADARVLDDAAPTMIAVAEDADASHLEGVATVVRLPRAKVGLDIEALLRELDHRGVRGMFLEGGPTLAASFVPAGLVSAGQKGSDTGGGASTMGNVLFRPQLGGGQRRGPAEQRGVGRHDGLWPPRGRALAASGVASG
jgi:riboflavin-specific deaminase-like protein